MSHAVSPSRDLGARHGAVATGDWRWAVAAGGYAWRLALAVRACGSAWARGDNDGSGRAVADDRWVVDLWWPAGLLAEPWAAHEL